MNWTWPWSDDSSEEDTIEVESRCITEEITLTYEFTEYRLKIEYEDGETERVECVGYSTDGDVLYLFEHDVSLTTFTHFGSSRRGTPTHETPEIKASSVEKSLISTTNYKKVNVTGQTDFVYVLGGVEVERHQLRAMDDDEWRTEYTDFEPDDERDYDTEIETWYKNEWEAENE